jgi:predicted PhzF superfamily epimerase YddE/YHI9
MRCMHTTAPDSGGLANVHWLTNVSPNGLSNELQVAAESLFASGEVIDCTQVFVAGEDGRYVAESFTPQGGRIKFCGLGALAAARVVFDQHKLKAAVLEFSNLEQSWQARQSASDSDIAATDSITLTYKRPSPTDCAVPAFVAPVLGVQPLTAAKVGGPTGYMLLEVADASALQVVEPDFSALTAATERALIVTAKAMHPDGPGIAFRYFAPQYGTPEDAATGSAAVQLAAFWSSRLARERFTAVQMSPQGAWLQLGCSSDSVDLTAPVEYR